MERNSDFKKEKIHLHLIVTIILSLVLTTKGFSQEKSKKELKKRVKRPRKN